MNARAGTYCRLFWLKPIISFVVQALVLNLFRHCSFKGAGGNLDQFDAGMIRYHFSHDLEC